MKTLKYLKCLKNLQFLIIIGLLSVSTWLDLISVLTYVGYELEVTPMQLAMVSIAMLAPQALLGRLFVTALKHYSTQSILNLSTLVRVVCTLALFWVNSFEWLLLLLLVRAFAIGFFQPVIAAESKSILAGSGSRFASVLSLINTISRIVAPAIGGVLSVAYGEKSVFLISALLGAVAWLLLVVFPLTPFKRDDEKDATRAGEMDVPSQLLLMFGLSILFINGISLMFTNLLPYTLNYYEVPKITLSFALSAAAVGGILFNLFIIKKNPRVEDFPILHIYFSWMLMAVGFGLLATIIPIRQIVLVMVPVVFVGLTLAKAYFEVFTNAYIFSQTKSRAIALSTIKQTIASYGGIVATIAGAIGISGGQPVGFLQAVAVFSAVVGTIWLLWAKRQL